MIAFRRNRITWLAYLLLAFYGYFLNILGPITPFLMDELKLSYTQASFHFTAFAAGILINGLLGYWLIERVGSWSAIWLGAVGISLGALVLTTARNSNVTITACFLMGFIGSLILTIVPSWLSRQHSEHRSVALAEANVIASLVATLAPILVGWFALTAAGWRFSMTAVAFAPVLLFLGLGKRAPSSASQEKNTHSAKPQTRSALPRVFWIFWAALMLAVSVEFTMIFWSADYMQRELELATESAAQLVSLFLAGMIIGRIASSRLIHRITTQTVIYLSIFVAGIGFMIYWTASSAWVGAAGLFLTGLGVASLYPLILSLAIGSAGEASVEASARATLASGTAILTLPLILGRLADFVGIRPAYGVIVLLLIGAFFLVQLAERALRRQGSSCKVESSY